MTVLPIEYIRENRTFREKLPDGTEIVSFEVPRHKFFAKGEILYLALALDYSEERMYRLIDEMKLGYVTVNKLWAIRLDEDVPFNYNKRVLLPLLDEILDLVDADTIKQGEDFKTISFSVGKYRDFIRVYVRYRVEFKDVVILRRDPLPAVIHYHVLV